MWLRCIDDHQCWSRKRCEWFVVPLIINDNIYPQIFEMWWTKMRGEIDLECLYEACQSAVTAGDSFTDACVNEWGEDECQQKNGNEIRWRGQRTDRSRRYRLRWKRLVKEEGFDFVVKLTSGKGKTRSRISESDKWLTRWRLAKSCSYRSSRPILKCRSVRSRRSIC